MPTKLNIGAGDVVMEGWTPIDRRFGHEAFPLKDYEDNTVDEIRSSHVLEHFDFGDTPKVLEEWTRVLKVGARMRIAVPDFDKISGMKSDPKWPYYLMGGQTNGDDFHRSVWDKPRLALAMQNAGLAGITEWAGDGVDCASLDCSLNLEGFKADPEKKEVTVKIAALMSLPRYGTNEARGCIESALHPFGIPLTTSSGVFWGQCMQRMFEDCVDHQMDWILTVDYDSMPTKYDIDKMFSWFGRRSDIDALSCLQCRRSQEFPLMTIEGQKNAKVDGQPLKVTTAHFGLTLIRVDALKEVPKPWFHSRPDEDGRWTDARMDDDIWFWHQWNQSGKTLFVATDVRVGHLEEMVAIYNEKMEAQHISVKQWREEFAA